MSDRLIDRWLAGTASDQEVAELNAALTRDPTLVTRLFNAAVHECDLDELFTAAERRVERIEQAVHAPPPAARSALRFEHREPRMRQYWLPLAGAAVLILAVALGFSEVRRHAAQTRADNVTRSTPAGVTAAAPRSTGPATPEPAIAKLTSANQTSTTPADDAVALSIGEPGSVRPVVVASNPRTSEPTNLSTSTPPTPRMPLTAALATKERRPPIDRVDGELKDGDGRLVMRYSLRAPSAVSSTSGTTSERERLGLVLCFHGAGGDERWLADPTLAALRANGVDDQFVVASLKSKGKDWASDDVPDVLAFLRWAEHTYAIDARRVVAEGVSNGSYFVNLLSSRHPDLLAGVIGMCNGYGLQDVRKSDGSGPAYYVVHGAADADVNVKSSRHATATLRANGYRVTYREYPGVGHDVFGDEPTRRDFARWLERLRSRQTLGEQERKALAAFEKRDEADRLLQTDDGANDLLRIGGVEAELVLARSLRSKSPAARAAAARLFARTACSPGAPALLAQLFDDKDAGVRQAAAQSLTAAADWGDQEALIAICRFAGAKNRERDERLDVARMLATSLSFRSTASADNQLIYELFVHLLDDEELALRTLAIESLARTTGDDRGFRAEAQPAVRREAISRWRKWYLEQFAPTDEKSEKNEKK